MERRFLSRRRSHGLRDALSRLHLSVMFLGATILFLGAYTINSTVNKTTCLTLLAVGALVMILSFTGYFGAQVEHSGFLKTYSCSTALLLILQIALLGLVYVNRAEIPLYGSRAWDICHEYDPQALVQFEQLFQCCGYESLHDRPEPASCPAMMGRATSVLGCRQAVANSIHQWHDQITIGIVVLLGFQITALLTSVIVTIMIERTADEERAYRALLPRQLNTHTWLDNAGPGSSSHGGSSSHVFGRQAPPPWSRTSIYNQSSPPAYSALQRVPRYGSTVSTVSK